MPYKLYHNTSTYFSRLEASWSADDGCLVFGLRSPRYGRFVPVCVFSCSCDVTSCLTCVCQEHDSILKHWPILSFLGLTEMSMSYRLRDFALFICGILIIKPTRCTNISNLFLDQDSTCFGQFLCPSSRVQYCTHSSRYMSYRFC